MLFLYYYVLCYAICVLLCASIAHLYTQVVHTSSIQPQRLFEHFMPGGLTRSLTPSRKAALEALLGGTEDFGQLQMSRAWAKGVIWPRLNVRAFSTPIRQPL